MQGIISSPLHMFSLRTEEHLSSCRSDYFHNSTGIVKREKNQQDATIVCLLLTSASTCFGHHYAHLQEIKDRVTAFGRPLHRSTVTGT